MSDETHEPRVWLGCLACYNAGALIGEWMSAAEAANMTPAELHRRVIPSGGNPTHDELWVMDSENVPTSGEFGQQQCRDIADAHDQLDDDDRWPAYCAWSQDVGDGDVSDFEDAYQGEYDSREDFAQELAESLGAIPEDYSWPASYIDWERATRDLFMDYSDAPAPGGRVYVYRA